MKKIILLIPIALYLGDISYGQAVKIDASAPKRAISPYIYGKNNSLSDNSSGTGNALTAAEWQRLRDLGIQMFRENGGNNATKYNWRLKLSSHPDWYNNVYAHDWDYAAKSLHDNIPSAQGMWAFQLIGKAAKTGSANFNDWSYNQSQWWDGVKQNLCGGGEVNPLGGEVARVNGNPSLYLENWNADSTTGILDHWFGTGGAGLDPDKIQYWSMDNEPEIWNGTHDDVYPVQPDAETFMQSYFAVAKKARARYPGIKLMGPVPANEWQWYNWNGDKISYNGKEYTWLEYFILRIAEEQQASGIRLLDVLDIHFYPGETNPADIVQLHRIFFDSTYVYPGANGVKRSGSGAWDNNLNKEYIFKRCNNWLNKYIGPNHGVTFSVSETSIAKRDNPNLTAVWYASTMGEFAKQGVEIFTPWDWFTGMSEVVHLFSHYGKKFYVAGTSSQEQYVSVYPTINYTGDSMTIFLVNRHLTESRMTDLNLTAFAVKDGTCKLYTLSNLPASETFVSHASNALKQTTVQATGNMMNIQLAPLSVSAIVLTSNLTVYNQYGELLTTSEAEKGTLKGVTISSGVPGYSGTGYVTSLDSTGNMITLTISVPVKDIYEVVIRYIGTSGESTQNLTLNNGFTRAVSFPASASFASTDAGGFVLNAGNNTLAIRHSLGSSDIDRIEVYRIEKKKYNIAPELVDTAATESTKALYDYLQYQFGNRIISGQTHDYYNQVKTLTGKSPMIRAGDFQHFTQGYAYLWDNVNNRHSFGYDKNDGSVNALINWYNSTGKKGIVSFHWHWHSPSGALSSTAGTNTFYTNQTTFDISQAVIPGTPEYNFVIRDIDSIAFQLKKLQQAGIPVLWRPLHEAGGGWFWWGAKGPEPCKALYNILFDRLKNYHQLHNLIWVWSSPEPAWYPGNDKVDMIGHDSYPGNYNYDNQKDAFDALYMLTRGEKLIAMTENGPIPDPDSCLQQDAPWAYFMSWSNLVIDQNSGSHIQDVYSNPNVLTVESTNAKTGFDWRSSLYPENWKPGYKDSQGRFLHDFSYAGYHKGENELPHITRNVVDITQPPYNADNTGTNNVTTVIQQALDDVGQAGGGVVYLPSGTYRITVAGNASYALRIAYDSTVLRGAGSGSTFLLNESTNMRNKDILRITGNDANWFVPDGTTTAISSDIIEPTRVLPVQSVAGFSVGNQVIVTSTPTPEFIAEHKMTGYWTASAIKGVAFLRTIDSIDSRNKLLIIDAPTRYALKTRDNARVYHAKTHISECGIEDLSIGNIENPTTGWEEESYSLVGTGAYEVHSSHAIHIKYSENCWVKNVSTFRPSENSEDFHLLSNGVKLNQSRFITIDSCSFEKPQYEGGGGNGYMYTLESNDCLIKNSRANHGRHNYDFKYPYSNGNVILECRGENSKYASDFHMYLSMSNLIDDCVLNGDYLESAFRPYGGDALHGYTSAQSVFYNTTGEAYHPDRNYIIDSRQFGWGYIIGTSGAASNVVIDPAEGSVNGYSFNTTPRDFTEGIGKGNYLVPASLYLDQLDRRLKDFSVVPKFHVEILVKDAATKALIPGCKVVLNNDTILTNNAGIASYENVLEFFVLGIKKRYCIPMVNQPFQIYSDTTLTLYLTRERYNVTCKLLRAGTYEVFSGTSVIFNSATQVTNTLGEAFFTVYGGLHDYSISKVSYQPESGSVTIQSDTILIFYLLQTHAYAKFYLKAGASPLNLASVVIDEDTVISNSLGISLFNQLPVSTSYTYLITKDDYNQKEGTFFLTGDTAIDVAISIKTANTEVPEEGTKAEYWPNPVDDLLNVYLPGSNSGKIVRIMDLQGVELSKQVIDKNNLQLYVKNFPSGIYILQTISGEVQTSQFFIKK
jgi:beta-mannanase